MADLTDAIFAKHASDLSATIPGGCWLGRAPKEKRDPSGTFQTYSELHMADLSDGARLPTGADIERFFGGGRLNNMVVRFDVTAASLATCKAATVALVTAFDEATLAVTDATPISFLQYHDPIYEDLHVTRPEGALYRGTVHFEAVTQD